MKSRQRRMKGEGSITKMPTGKYRVRLEIAPSPRGTRQWLTAVVATQKEATSKLQEFQRQKTKEATIEKLKASFRDFMDDYLDYKKTEGISGSTLYPLELLLKTTADFFGFTPVQKITPELLQSLIEHWKDDKGNKDTSIRVKFKRISNYFDWLKTTKKALAYNPCLDVKLIRRKTKKHQKLLTISQEEHEKLKTVMQSYWDSDKSKKSFKSKFFAVYLLAYETGMREGEIAGLRQKSIDFDTNTVTVENSLAYTGEGYVDNPPKTAAGYRDIVITGKTMGILKELCHNGEEFVFSNHGKPYSVHSYLLTFKEFQEEAKLDNRFTFHTIRHTNASIMIAKGVPTPVITERLGHSSVGVTYNTYAHALRDSKERKEALVEA